MTENHNHLVELSNALADAVERAGSTTVLVDGRRRIPASGILYQKDFVLTAEHVLERDEEINIMLPDGNELTASIAGRDPGSDLALLQLSNSASDVAEVSDEAARVGQIVVALGRPSESGIQASLGIVSAVGGGMRVIRRDSEETGPRRKRGFHWGRFKYTQVPERFIRTDAIPYPGFSGGPLIDAHGKIVGINTSGLFRGVSIAIPVDRAWQIAKSLSEHGSVRRGYLGIRSQPVPIPSAQQQALGRNQSTGLLIVWVEENSAAEKGSLLVGDILVAFDQDPISSSEDLQILLAGEVVGQSIPIEILRGGEPVSVTITVGERK